MKRVLLEIAAFVFVAVLILTDAPLTVLRLGLHAELEGTSTLRVKALAARRFSRDHRLQAGKWFKVGLHCKAACLASGCPATLYSTIMLQDYDH